jgi:TRAP-type C4-dicarboxylate transport system substrate-binding protein
MALVMNKRVYEGLPDDLRAVIDANSGANLAPLAGEVLDAAEAEEREKALAAGGEVVVIPEADLEAWKAATQPVIDDWVENTENGAEALDAARAMIAAQRGE